jgi:hypothetical protein
MDMNSTVARHPADFQLVKLGIFDDQNAEFTNSFESIGPVVSFLQPRAPSTDMFSPLEPVKVGA